jgi:glycosyltransferase involved in cell wall biosynthesis
MARKQDTEWRLVIVGEGPERSELTQLAADMGVGECTSFDGFVTRPEAYMAHASIFVLSSRFEGFPNALLESMAMGAAVVSSDCSSGPRELISDGKNGRLFKPGDVLELSAILRELMMDAEQRSRLGTEALRVRDTFALPNIMAQWEGALADMVGRRS